MGHRVYYSVHANAVIGARGNQQGYTGAGGRAWAKGMRILKSKIKADMERGYAVRVGGDMNYPMGKGPWTPQTVFEDLGFEYHQDRVMWLAWDPKYDKVVDRKTLGVAPGADAHHAIMVILDSRQDSKPKPEPVKVKRVIVTTNTEDDKPVKVKDDIAWVTENWKPDLWAFQNSAKYIDDLRAVEGYGVALPPRTKNAEDRQLPVLFNSKQYRHVGSKNLPHKLASHHFRDRSTGDSVYVVNTQLPEHMSPETKDHISRFAQIAEDRADGDSYVFWAGDFIEDRKDQDKLIEDAGLLSAFEELNTKKDRLSIGSVVADKRVKAVSVNSAHGSIKAVYSITTDGGRDNDPTDPGSEPDPEPAKTPKSEKDNGTDLDHSECCGGYSDHEK